MAYTIEFAESVKAHLEALTAKQRVTVLAKIESHLTSQPLVETRNRKPLRPNPVAPWELRVGQLRVFYDVSEGPPATIRISSRRCQGAERRSDRWGGDSAVKTIKLSQASRPLAEYAATLRDEIVVLTERNRAVAAIVPLKKADRESVALSGHPEFLKMIERSRADFRSGRVISLEAMKNELKVQQSPPKKLLSATTKKSRRVKGPRRSRG